MGSVVIDKTQKHAANIALDVMLSFWVCYAITEEANNTL